MNSIGTVSLLGDSESWHGWWFVAPLWLLLWVVVLTTILRGGLSRCRRGRGAPSARDVLAGRFARGEIDADEYRSRRSTLEE